MEWTATFALGDVPFAVKTDDGLLIPATAFSTGVNCRRVRFSSLIRVCPPGLDCFSYTIPGLSNPKRGKTPVLLHQAGELVARE